MLYSIFPMIALYITHGCKLASIVPVELLVALTEWLPWISEDRRTRRANYRSDNLSMITWNADGKNTSQSTQGFQSNSVLWQKWEVATLHFFPAYCSFPSQGCCRHCWKVRCPCRSAFLWLLSVTFIENNFCTLVFREASLEPCVEWIIKSK